MLPVWAIYMYITVQYARVMLSSVWKDGRRSLLEGRERARDRRSHWYSHTYRYMHYPCHTVTLPSLSLIETNVHYKPQAKPFYNCFVSYNKATAHWPLWLRYREWGRRKEDSSESTRLAKVCVCGRHCKTARDKEMTFLMAKGSVKMLCNLTQRECYLS